ncbi:hypothetical protein Ddc_13576 [Ditylenchus destructor]|nr:hypothetical protein Ddc_13576 [Ditylenchus destructor]
MAVQKEQRKREYIKKQIKVIGEKSREIAGKGEVQYVVAATKNGNTVFHVIEKTIKQNGQLVYIVDKAYFTTESLQYALVQGASKVLLPLSLLLDTVRVGSALYRDLKTEEKQMRHTAVAVSSIAGGWAGAAAGAYGGAETGAAAGASIGAFFGGVGAIPGATLGTVCGTIAGAISGGILGSAAAEKAAQKVTDRLYGVPVENVQILEEGDYEVLDDENSENSLHRSPELGEVSEESE